MKRPRVAREPEEDADKTLHTKSKMIRTQSKTARQKRAHVQKTLPRINDTIIYDCITELR